MRKFLTAAIVAFCSISASATTHTIVVGNGGNNFAPTSLTLSLGDTVLWVWSAGFHNTSGATFPGGAPTWYSNISSTTTSFIYVPTVSGLYTYDCTYHSGMSGQFRVSGCNYPTFPNISSSNGRTACQGAAVMLSTPAQAGATYQWLNGSTIISGATSSSLNATISGAYKVNVNRCGVDSVSAPFAVTIYSIPAPTFTQSHAGLAYTFTNTTSPLHTHSYLWTFSDGSPNQTSVDASRTFNLPGTYSVTLKATDTATGCFSTSEPVTIQASLSVAGLPGASYSICPNPAISIINIETRAEARLKLTDLRGRIVPVPSEGCCKKYTIDITALPPGLYLLHIFTRDGYASQKISLVR